MKCGRTPKRFDMTLLKRTDRVHRETSTLYCLVEMQGSWFMSLKFRTNQHLEREVFVLDMHRVLFCLYSFVKNRLTPSPDPRRGGHTRRVWVVPATESRRSGVCVTLLGTESCCRPYSSDELFKKNLLNFRFVKVLGLLLKESHLKVCGTDLLLCVTPKPSPQSPSSESGQRGTVLSLEWRDLN